VAARAAMRAAAALRSSGATCEGTAW